MIKTLKSKLASLWNANEQGRALRKTLNSSGDSSKNKINKNNNGLFTSIKGDWRLMIQNNTNKSNLKKKAT